MKIFAPLLSLLVIACSAEAATVQNGMNAYQQSRIADAERMFGEVLADPKSSPGDKAAANREMARIAWLVDRDRTRALASLDAAEATGEGVCDALLMRNRILQESGLARRLLDGVPAQLARCKEPEKKQGFDLEAAEAALALASAGDETALGTAREFLARAGEDAGKGLPASEMRLEIGLLGGDAATALQGWKDYFWLADTDVPQGLAGHVRSAAPIFGAGVAADAMPEARLALVDLLVRAGFARAAERFAVRHKLAAAAPAHPLWRKASAYFRERKRLEDLILASNRRVARGGKADNFQRAVSAAQDALMAAAGLKGDRKQAVRQAYGLYGTVGETGGFASVHLGHIAQDERRRIDQYGHRADVGFLALDNMVSNGYETWLWDGSAAAGGWTEAGPVIVQVRPEYTSDPLIAWRLVGNPAARAKFVARGKEREAVDREALRSNDVAFLPGLGSRLRLQAAEQVLARARILAGEGGDLRRAFLDEYARAVFQQSIFVHEGRHALDKKLLTGLARMNDTNLEYRAKLSELALADYPRLALFNINSSTIGGGTAHGNANGKIMAAYANWINSNRSQVAGFDPSVPALAQIDRLSDAQVRELARSLDPIAR